MVDQNSSLACSKGKDTAIMGTRFILQGWNCNNIKKTIIFPPVPKNLYFNKNYCVVLTTVEGIWHSNLKYGIKSYETQTVLSIKDSQKQRGNVNVV